MERIKSKKKEDSNGRIWHKQQELILKKWGESALCYRYMHERSYEKYKSLSMRYTLPIIIISTITGTANFAQETFPVSMRPYVPAGIGGLNLFAAILTTVLQFLKINELMENHRVTAISFGKLSRFIRLELTLPQYERSQDGIDMINVCKTDYDRLIEQSPHIPEKIMNRFKKSFKSSKNKELNLHSPEIMELRTIEPYSIVDEEIVVTNTLNAFKNKINEKKKIHNITGSKDSKHQTVIKELTELKNRKMVSNVYKDDTNISKNDEDNKSPKSEEYGSPRGTLTEEEIIEIKIDK